MNSQDLPNGRRSGDWAKVIVTALLSMAISLATFSYGYGRLEGRVATLERDSGEHNSTIEKLALNVARICTRLNAGCKE